MERYHAYARTHIYSHSHLASRADPFRYSITRKAFPLDLPILQSNRPLWIIGRWWAWTIAGIHAQIPETAMAIVYTEKCRWNWDRKRVYICAKNITFNKVYI